MVAAKKIAELIIELRTIQAWEKLMGEGITSENRETQRRRRAEIVLELAPVTCVNAKNIGLCPMIEAAVKSR